MSDILSKIPSSILVQDSSDKTQVNKALLNQIQSSNKIVDAVNSVNTALTAQGQEPTIGTNSNGIYIQWPNGLMICLGVIPISSSGTSGSGTPCQYFFTGTWAYPAAFVDASIKLAVSIGYTAASYDAAPGYSYGATNSQVSYISYSSNSGTSFTRSVSAIGFYK